MRVQASRITRLLFRRSLREVSVDAAGLYVVARQETRRLPHAAIADVRAARGLIWDKIEVVLHDGALPALSVHGVPRGQAESFRRAWRAWALRTTIGEAASTFRQLLERDAYFNHWALERWREITDGFGRQLPAFMDDLPLSPDFYRDIADCRRFLAASEQIVSARNDAYVQRQSDRYAQWFDSVLGDHPLTVEQREAILRDEDNALVIAGAGTGKTSTIVGKAAFLLKTGTVRRERMLLLAFTRKAAGELRDRIHDALGIEVEIRTFHSLGREIVRQAEQRAPSVSKLASDEDALSRMLTRFVQDLLADSAAAHAITTFIAYYLYPYRSPFECPSAHEYYQYLRSHGIRTLQGELVKSFEEMVIANWLYLHGIRYEYERPYEHETATLERRQYYPDFYLLDHGIYIEHFGVDRDGNTAPFVDREQYHEGMQWKQDTHRTFGTRLMVTYSYEYREGTLTERLDRDLRECGVQPRPLSPDALLEQMREQRLVEPLTRLLSTFLRLCKGNQWTVDELRAMAAQRADRPRVEAFLHVFELLYERYETELHTHREIDFDDMIRRAIEYVESGRYESRFTHILVDEFQDISRGRARLLMALLGQVPDRRLFCVGDDWQSIYRFTGSDVGQMLHFAETFGYTADCRLTLTHRFSEELLHASSRFVQENPAQIRKALRATTRLNAPAIQIVARTPGENEAGALLRVLDELYEESTRRCRSMGGPSATVLVLSRNGFNLTAIPGDAALKRRYPGMTFERMTVHKAKGLEADYAVVLGVVSGRAGFPAEMADDPVLELVLADHGAYPNAEERRLFYVALTRAKRRCVVVTSEARRSVFAAEIGGQRYGAWVIGDGRRGPACPECNGGTLVPRTGKFGEFLGCTNHPYCNGRSKRCTACGRRTSVRMGDVYRCVADGCGAAAKLCPRCGIGALVLRKGQSGQFYGCSQWQPGGGSHVMQLHPECRRWLNEQCWPMRDH